MASRTGAERRTPANTRILLIEDNDHARIMVAEVLRAAGYAAVHPARDAIEAWGKLAFVEPHLIVTDWTLPGMDGLALVERIRAAVHSPDSSVPDPKVPVVMLTGQRTRSAVAAARDAGVDEFVIKPFAPAVLLTRIGQVLEARREFVASAAYVGPDRRRRDPHRYRGALRRADDAEIVVVERERTLFRQSLAVEIEALQALIRAQVASGGIQRDLLALSLRRMTEAADQAHALKLELIARAARSLDTYGSQVAGAPDDDVVQTHLETLASLLALGDDHHREGRVVVEQLERLVARKLAGRLRQVA